MRKLLWALMAVAVSACGGVEMEQGQVAGEQPVAAEAAAQPTCELARELGYSEADVLSCEQGAPVEIEGYVANAEGEVSAQACNTYYGSCMGISGCSRAVGEGYSYTECGSWKYVWMTVCDGVKTGWGVGGCVW